MRTTARGRVAEVTTANRSCGRAASSSVRARQGHDVVDVFDFGFFNFAVFGEMVARGEKFANGSDAGPAVSAPHHITGDKSIFPGPGGPHPRDRGSGIDQNAIHIEQQRAAANFHEQHDN